MSSFEAPPQAMSVTGREDARSLLVGRWKLCGGSAYYGPVEHAGLEFGSNGRNQPLWSSGGKLVGVSGGPRGVYYLLGSGQFMQRGEIPFGGFAARAKFDATRSVLQLESDNGVDAPLLRYVRVEPDERSAADNTFSTASADCSMVGVWDTAIAGDNSSAAFAFNERGEWFGGERGSDLCAAHTMYGTYNLETRGGNVMDNFDQRPARQFLDKRCEASDTSTPSRDHAAPLKLGRQSGLSPFLAATACIRASLTWPRTAPDSGAQPR